MSTVRSAADSDPASFSPMCGIPSNSAAVARRAAAGEPNRSRSAAVELRPQPRHEGEGQVVGVIG